MRVISSNGIGVNNINDFCAINDVELSVNGADIHKMLIIHKKWYCGELVQVEVSVVCSVTKIQEE